MPPDGAAATDRYTHGHHEAVLRSHLWRNAENSAAYLLPHLRPGQSLLDVGCGPGNLTLDLARRVAPGSVVGIDQDEGVISKAGELAVQGDTGSVSFASGDAYSLDFEDAYFDVVHAHQLLHHLRDPVGALREMRRVLRPGGLLAVRESDYGSFAWAPEDAMLERWRELFGEVSSRNGGNSDAGRHLLEWTLAAGFESARASSSTWTFADAESRLWWGGMWAERVEASSFAEQAVEYGLSSKGELASIAAAWRRWAGSDSGYFVAVHGEVLATPAGNGAGTPGPPFLTGIDHVQLAMPAGEEDRASAFYQDLLGLRRVPKPEHLARRGGCWFESPRVKVHLGVDKEFRPATKAHPALLVDGLGELVTRLRAAGCEVYDDEPLEGYSRVYISDPFGNRVELMERLRG